MPATLAEKPRLDVPENSLVPGARLPEGLVFTVTVSVNMIESKEIFLWPQIEIHVDFAG
jgi:hypothetical protein